MKQFIFIMGLLSFGIFQTGCIIDNVFDCEHGRGNVVEEEFGLDVFDEVRLRIDADVFITQGDEHRARIVAQGNIIDEIDFRIRNRSLRIDHHRCLRDHENIEIYLTMSDIRALKVFGSGNMVGENFFEVGEIDLTVSGSGNINVGLDADEVEAHISGSGDITVEGEANRFDYRVSGSGDFYGFDLTVDRADIHISGSGDVEITVTEILDVRISGSGDVFYRGNPTLDVKTFGSGQVIDAN